MRVLMLGRDWEPAEAHCCPWAGLGRPGPGMWRSREAALPDACAQVAPEAFCELWIRDTKYVQQPCVALTVYVAMCHKFHVCIEWRRSDYCRESVGRWEAEGLSIASVAPTPVRVGKAYGPASKSRLPQVSLCVHSY